MGLLIVGAVFIICNGRRISHLSEVFADVPGIVVLITSLQEKSILLLVFLILIDSCITISHIKLEISRFKQTHEFLNSVRGFVFMQSSDRLIFDMLSSTDLYACQKFVWTGVFWYVLFYYRYSIAKKRRE